MQYVTLSDNGLKLSRLVAGVMKWGSWGKNYSKNDMASYINELVEVGISSFDHADIYGGYTTEQSFGAAFKHTEIKRSNVQLITKCGIKNPSEERPYNLKSYQTTANYISWSCEQSLKKLGTDYIDLFLIHRPSPLMHPEVIAEAFLKLKKEGKVLHFGVSNFTFSQHRMLSKYITLATNQIEISILERSSMLDGRLDLCLENKVKPMAWSPMGGIRLFEKSADYEHVMMRSRLQSVCEKYNWTLDQLAIIFLLHHPSHILPVLGTTNIARMKRAIDLLDIQISDEQWFEIWTAATGEKVP